jgi:hypothetical protein
MTATQKQIELIHSEETRRLLADAENFDTKIEIFPEDAATPQAETEGNKASPETRYAVAIALANKALEEKDLELFQDACAALKEAESDLEHKRKAALYGELKKAENPMLEAISLLTYSVLSHKETRDDQRVTMRYLGVFQNMYDRARTAVSEFVLGRTEIHELIAGNSFSIDDISELLEFLGVEAKIPSWEAVAGTGRGCAYYKDLPGVIDFIDSVGEEYYDGYDKTEDLLFVKSIAVLSWRGFSEREMQTMQKSAVFADKKTKPARYYASGGGKTVEISAREYSILKGLADADSHRGFPSGVVRYYKGYEKRLFRPVTLAEACEYPYLKSTLQRFNAAASLRGKVVTMSALKKNGLFVKIYEDKTRTSIYEKIANNTGVASKTSALKFKAEYLIWEAAYHGDNTPDTP